MLSVILCQIGVQHETPLILQQLEYALKSTPYDSLRTVFRCAQKTP